MTAIRLDPQFQLDPTQRLRSPGDVLRDDYMLPAAMTATELARRTGLPLRQVRRVIHGEPIDAECAIRFAAVFRTTALYWMVLQVEFDMARERRRHLPGGLGVR
ncbi:addiction module antidote protein, HigA family [Dyella jiangningensis]|uniref:HigA family addiction module antitoxin n=1 Tax=Dyella sp. AtDHG13 TaxID=1938897 RepID=UPI0008904544|nr:HigA family addiction module antitoxin [Dyella sp. AtDHG13]PXV54050.1 addiction module HigA family antidote [Dyella sp. AtDHG13]SDL09841.1 addiction module antidote protein, HigA family [Dyella jiangningensis]